MLQRDSITQDLVRQLLDYCLDTGLFVWKIRPGDAVEDRKFNARFAGKRALENVSAVGYKVGTIRCVHVYAHRVAWLWVTGDWPEATIDHIDGDRLNNAFANLRAVDRSENNKNIGARSNKLSGLPRGVFLAKGGPNPFKAQIVVGRKAVHLGHFPDIASAQAAYRAAAQAHGFSDRHIQAD